MGSVGSRSGEAVGEWCLSAERRGGEEGMGEVEREFGWERDCSVGILVRELERERSMIGRVIVDIPVRFSNLVPRAICGKET